MCVWYCCHNFGIFICKTKVKILLQLRNALCWSAVSNPSTICWSFWLYYHKKSVKSRCVWLVLQDVAFLLIYLVICSQNPDSRFRLSLPPHLARSVRAPRGGGEILILFLLSFAGAAGTCVCVDPYLIMHWKETRSKLNDHRAFSDIGGRASMCPFFFTNFFCYWNWRCVCQILPT